jgi:hypothetical protein
VPATIQGQCILDCDSTLTRGKRERRNSRPRGAAKTSQRAGWFFPAGKANDKDSDRKISFHMRKLRLAGKAISFSAAWQKRESI